MTDARRPSVAQMTSYRARRHLWLRPGQALVCPNGHRLHHNAALLQHDAFICQTRVGGQGECGSRVYVLVFPGGLRFVAEVTTQEMLFMRDQSMGVEDAVAYLSGAA